MQSMLDFNAFLAVSYDDRSFLTLVLYFAHTTFFLKDVFLFPLSFYLETPLLHLSWVFSLRKSFQRASDIVPPSLQSCSRPLQKHFPLHYKHLSTVCLFPLHSRVLKSSDLLFLLIVSTIPSTVLMYVFTNLWRTSEVYFNWEIFS